jgi:NADPH-dependent curcumin reductase CurA
LSIADVKAQVVVAVASGPVGPLASQLAKIAGTRVVGIAD